MEIFNKIYDGESIVDVDRDFSEVFDERFNSIIKSIPTNEYGIMEGSFNIVVKWKSDEN